MTANYNALEQRGKRVARFGDFALDFRAHALFRGPERISLPQQAARILEMLIERHGELVTRDEIRREIWGDRHVDFEASLNTAIRKIRRALGDDAAAPAHLETLPKSGYRFLKTPEFSTGDAARKPSESKTRAFPPAIVLAAAAFAIAATSWVLLLRTGSGSDAGQSSTEFNSPGYEAFLFGSHAMGQGEFEKAENHFEESLRQDADYAHAYVGLAHAKVRNRQGQFSKVAEGQALLDKALSIDPGNANGIHLNARIALYYWRDHEKAMNFLDRALAAKPDDPDVLTTPRLLLYHNQPT